MKIICSLLTWFLVLFWLSGEVRCSLSLIQACTCWLLFKIDSFHVMWLWDLGKILLSTFSKTIVLCKHTFLLCRKLSFIFLVLSSSFLIFKIGGFASLDFISGVPEGLAYLQISFSLCLFILKQSWRFVSMMESWMTWLSNLYALCPSLYHS